MKSLRESARRAGINGAPLSARNLAQRSGLPTPFLMSQLMGALEKGATPGRVEEVKFRQIVVTPSGTALGGAVDLTLRSDGTYKVHFHMHDSGLVDYKFVVRAVFAAGNGLSFAWQFSGSVEGTESTTFTRGPRRNSDKDIEGTHPLIRDNWAAIKAGKFSVSKDYSRAGIVGFIEDVAKSIVGLAKAIGKGVAAAVVGLGEEIVNAFNSLGLAGDLGILAGVVVFAFGGSLVLAVTAGVAVGAMTKAFVKQRPVTQAELGFAARVFGGSLPPANKIILTNLEGLGGRAFTMPGLGGNIYLNVGSYCLDHPLTHIEKSYPKPGQLFIHELVHAWQIKNRSFVPGWVCDGLAAQTINTFGSAYKYVADGFKTWSDFNIEQQASIVDDWFGGTRAAGQKQMDTTDPYYRYIRDNILNGRT
ncbi:hypothetical protein EON83_04945 [bacterium]|nr:MAG: hypothetical protein EON83_04945 [bacterium]